VSAEKRWEGYVESLKPGVVRGWAWDPEQPLTPIEVSLWDDHQNQVAVVKADELRIGLLKKGNGRHGFTYTLPEPWKDLRVVFAKFAGTDLYLRHCPRFRDDWEPVPPQTELYAQPRDVTNLGNCDFYHTMDLPGYGTVEGGWDLRGSVREYLGGVSFTGKRVLDVGKASGFLTFHMESQGAEVVAYDLSEYHGWDVIP
jgi:2-polyprenyl-3-methyl-5-hydroxy-6-metoxy-1,4-benzoquinol methylase